MTSTDRDPLPEEGRQIRLVPLAPGLWTVLLGCGAMVLGPLFGFLVGTMLGTDQKTLGMAPIFFFLFVGFMVAGLGLGTALLGIRRIVRDRRRAAR
jgi:hypothetical protein